MPDLAPIGLAKLLLCAICDRSPGNAATSVREFAALRIDSGATLVDLLESWLAGTVSMFGVHSLLIQLIPASVTVVTHADGLRYGPERSRCVAKSSPFLARACAQSLPNFEARRLVKPMPRSRRTVRIRTTPHARSPNRLGS